MSGRRKMLRRLLGAMPYACVSMIHNRRDRGLEENFLFATFGAMPYACAIMIRCH